jgi:hypothetical protein
MQNQVQNQVPSTVPLEDCLPGIIAASRSHRNPFSFGLAELRARNGGVKTLPADVYQAFRLALASDGQSRVVNHHAGAAMVSRTSQGVREYPKGISGSGQRELARRKSSESIHTLTEEQQAADAVAEIATIGGRIAKLCVAYGEMPLATERDAAFDRLSRLLAKCAGYKAHYAPAAVLPIPTGILGQRWEDKVAADSKAAAEAEAKAKEAAARAEAEAKAQAEAEAKETAEKEAATYHAENARKAAAEAEAAKATAKVAKGKKAKAKAAKAAKDAAKVANVAEAAAVCAAAKVAKVEPYVPTEVLPPLPEVLTPVPPQRKAAKQSRKAR